MTRIVAGSRSFGSLTCGVKRVSLACVALGCGFAATAASNPKGGLWTGTTSNGRPYNFEVNSTETAITTIQMGYSACGGGLFTISGDTPISGGSFSVVTPAPVCPQPATTGTFTSPTTASGTVSFAWDHPPFGCACSGTETTTWTATKVASEADLSVSGDDGTTMAVAGALNTYTIVVTNNGPEVVSSLSVTDTPASLLAPTFTPWVGTYDPATGAWTGLHLTTGQSATMTMTATVSQSSAGGTVTNTVSVFPGGGVSDPDPSNNTAIDTDTVVAQPDLSITKTGPAVLTPPTLVTWRITVTNNGPSDATGVQVTDATPSGLAFVSSSGACTGAFPCSLGAMAAGERRIIDATYSIPAGFTPATVDNTASVTAASSDPYLANNTTTITSQVVPPGPASSLHTIEPCRLLDTRAATGEYGGPALLAGEDRTFVATGPRCGIPAAANAISVNVTVTAPTVAGNLRLYPGGQPLPQVSTVNYSAGQTRANNAIVPLNGSGEFTIRCAQASGTAHAVVDVNGYFE